MEKQLTCKECQKPFEEYSVIEKGPMKDAPYEGIDICQDCMSLGWTDDPKEIIDSLNKDPLFSVGVESPYK